MILKPNPDLHLSTAELETWLYWSYGYWGSDGCDWRQYYTRKGISDIPDYAEEVQPIKPF